MTILVLKTLEEHFDGIALFNTKACTLITTRAEFISWDLTIGLMADVNDDIITTETGDLTRNNSAFSDLIELPTTLSKKLSKLRWTLLIGFHLPERLIVILPDDF